MTAPAPDFDAARKPMTITEFLLARIAEDEAAAEPLTHVFHGAGTQMYVKESWMTSPLRKERFLAECAAKRAIVEQAQKAAELERDWDEQEWQGTVEHTEPYAGDAILYALAAVHRDHPDYQEAWG